ncbi:MAG: MaoC family dehydratase N-terminal domain-containing protein [Anaerolineae bacterium]|nr:MaoC family dehydratase N-terminal domain-containing protein [Anaerolineae bacterium]NUQ03197.1 MaoC family dehydratase N-terminal domain-containing protein [Anaerolineae bacterium]
MTQYGVDLPLILGHQFEPITFTYTERDVCLYALGVGAPADPLDQRELQFVYERSGEGFKALPTYAVIYPSGVIDHLLTGDLPGLRFNPMMLLHGEQFLEIFQPLPTSGTITCQPKVSAVYDKGSGALVITDVPCYDEAGTLVALNQMSMFIRGIGGFGGERGPSTGGSEPPAREPDVVIRQQTKPEQALIYRLSGDINPLHADPMMAAFGSFDRPILHGLCSFGFSARHVLKAFADNDIARFKRIKARFVKHVFPGETLITEMWRESDQRILFQTRVAERDSVAISSAYVELR